MKPERNARTGPNEPKGKAHRRGLLKEEVGRLARAPDEEEDRNENPAQQAAREGIRAADSLGRTASSAYQKRKIRREYAAAKAGRAAPGPAASAVQTGKQAAAAGAGAKGGARRVRRRGKGWLALLAIALMLLYILNTFTACTPIVQAVLQAVVIGTYPAEEADVLAAEQAYRQMETDLQHELDNYTLMHPEIDEATIEQAELWHDPYALIALVCAMIGSEWTMDTAYPVLETIFTRQYEITVSVETETRYRTEVQFEYEWVVDPITGRGSWELLPREIEVPYEYRTATVTVKNNILSHLPCIMLSHDQLGMYALYMASLGNMPELFAGMPHASQLEEPQLYDVSQAYLDADPQFARLMEEAERYVGYPYVWGGGDPETSFDCSGFISWIFTETGVSNVGRLGATGLYGACRPVGAEEARPGDVIFFTGTLGEGADGNCGITHCGLYVGDGWMIHCGSPLGFADLSRFYWQEHFYGYGRLY